MGNFTFDQDVTKEKLTNKIIVHEYLLSIVDHVGFKEFSSKLQPLHKMVSHNPIIDDIMRIYAIEKEKISNYLEKLENRIAITTYMLTSNQKKGYIVRMVHINFKF